ncbi:MAG: RagB/SusD family nutrient uptake outer membrane protein [Bacteroidales bacterium]|nr:RagB/SusD family nutrient uptake outer membrane protein [Bacteroidales bacterium]
MKTIFNIKNILLGIISLTLMLLLSSCEDALKEEVFNELALNNFYQTDQDAEYAVNAVYAEMRNGGWGMFAGGTWSLWSWCEAQTDEVYVNWGGTHWGALESFTMRSNDYLELELCFKDLFEAVAMANSVLMNIKDADGVSDEMKNRVTGEATYGRALFYYYIYSFWGNVPIIDKFNPDPKYYPEQKPQAETVAFIIKDLKDAEVLLPLASQYSTADYGRFTKGAAQTLLARFYLNQKMWQEAADKAKDVIDSKQYDLSDDYGAIFAPDNGGNEEIILALPCIPQTNLGNTFLTHTTPGNFDDNPGWNGYRIRNDFYNTFDPDDDRRSYLAYEYNVIGGGTATVTDGALILKYSHDPNSAGEWASNDIVILRYAEVLLTRAEALNELNGPNQESIDLLNDIRFRAFQDSLKLLSLSSFTTKEALRAHILKERGWELYAEGYRRDDQLRQGTYISEAIKRGHDANDYHKLFPIPQIELDKNPNLKQNPGFN